MNLQNGYKVIYEKAADGKRTFYASKTGVFADAEKIVEATIGEYKLIYEKDGKFYGSASGIPTADDYCFEEFRAVFEEGYVAANTASVEDPENTTLDPEDPEDFTDPENVVDPESSNNTETDPEE